MELNEYYVKRIFERSGLPVLSGDVAYTPDEAEQIAQKIGGNSFWLKPQLMTTAPIYTTDDLMGRCYATSPQEVAQKATLIFGESFQDLNANHSSNIQRIYVEQATPVNVFCRLVFRVDFENGGITFALTQNDREILSLPITNMMLDKKLIQQVFHTLKIKHPKIKKEFLAILNKSFQLFLDYGAMAIELSPVVCRSNSLIVVDGRLIFDPDSLFRFPELEKCREIKLGHEREALAKKNSFRYTNMGGNIACIAGGIGLGWATIDLVNANKGSVACLLDVGTKPTIKSMTTAVKLALAEPNVDAILINIFAAGISCKDVVKGLLNAAGEIAIGIPIVVRLAGTDQAEAESLLRKSIVPFYYTTDMEQAVQEVVKQLKENN